MAQQGAIELVFIAARAFSRTASSASATLSVIRPSSWPVSTRGPPGWSARKSNTTPRAGSSSSFERNGSPIASKAETSRRLASSIFPHCPARTGSDRSGMVRLKAAQATHRVRCASGCPSGPCGMTAASAAAASLQAAACRHWRSAVQAAGAGLVRGHPRAGPVARIEGDDVADHRVETKLAAAVQAMRVAEEHRPAAAALERAVQGRFEVGDRAFGVLVHRRRLCGRSPDCRAPASSPCEARPRFVRRRGRIVAPPPLHRPRRILHRPTRAEAMKRVTGIGGIFFKARDPAALGAWYRDHLGLDVTEWGGTVFDWGGDGSEPGMTIWKPVRGRYRLHGARHGALHGQLPRRRPGGAARGAQGRRLQRGGPDRNLRARPVRLGDRPGNKVELWQPPARA